MKYNFDTFVNRRGTNSVKYDEMPTDETIALWVADMDFETAPVIREALMARLQHGCFGYTFVPDSYYAAVQRWFAERHGWQIERDSIIYTSGVVPAISAIIKGVVGEQHGRAIDMPRGAKVLIQTPVYNCFFTNILNNGCEIVENPLCYVREEGGMAHYEVDWEDFETRLSDPAVKVFILCNPHNPAGRVWSREELHRMGELCKQHDVFVISDEIHCEFVNPDFTDGYTPFTTVSDAPCAVCIAPTKAFNIAGLQIANIVVPDPDIRARVDRAININEVCDVNPFGVIALQAAYTPEGEEWLREVNAYIYSNYEAACRFFAIHLPEWTVTRLEGTYLMWVDVSASLSAECPDSQALADRLLREADVCVNAGVMYGAETGRTFIRINLATQQSRLVQGLQRVEKVVHK